MTTFTAPECLGDGLWRLALRTPTLPPATTTNAYLVGHERFYVVEPASPWNDQHASLAHAVDVRLALGHSLLGAIATHHHGDHIGGARSFCDHFGVALHTHPATAERLRGVVAATGDLIEGARLDDDALDVLHTPGHAPGHVCLHHRRDGWAIVGDMIASVGTILIDIDDDGDMNAYLAQLERLAARAPSRLLPAHGDPIDDSVARLRLYIRHRLAREARVLDAVRRDPTTLDDITRDAYADTPTAPRVLAERSARAHLQRLEVLAKVRHTDGRWRRCD